MRFQLPAVQADVIPGEFHQAVGQEAAEHHGHAAAGGLGDLEHEAPVPGAELQRRRPLVGADAELRRPLHAEAHGRVPVPAEAPPRGVHPLPDGARSRGHRRLHGDAGDDHGMRRRGSAFSTGNHGDTAGY